MLIVDSDDSLTELADAIARDNPSIECRRLERREIIARLGIAAPALDSSADALYLHLLGLRAPDSNLAPAEVTLRLPHARGAPRHLCTGRHHRPRHRSLVRIHLVSDRRYQGRYPSPTSKPRRRSAAQLQAQYLETARRFPATPTSAENLKRAVEIAQKIGASTRSPETMMIIVGQALDRNPAIRLKTLWLEVRAHRYRAAGPRQIRQAQTVIRAPAGGARQQSGLVEGEVRPFSGDYRAANESIARFAAALSQQPGVAEVRVVKAPLNVSPSLTLSGNTTDSSAPPGKAEFKLLLVLKSNGMNRNALHALKSPLIALSR